MSEKVSRLRQRLRESGEGQQLQLELVLGELGPLIRGTLGTRRRVCGKPSCRCTRGELHESTYLSASDQGQVRQVHVPEAEKDHVSAGVERYRHFREAKARLAELAALQLKLVDDLGRALLEPYPARSPLPPPTRIPRKMRKGQGGK